MKEKVTQFCEALFRLDAKSDDFVGHLYDVASLLDGVSGISDAFDPIFSFIESHPRADFGSPGPLVHLLEKYYPNYEPRLVQSLENKPTSLTVFMLSRILNAPDGQKSRMKYLLLLKSVAENEDADQLTKERAGALYQAQMHLSGV